MQNGIVADVNEQNLAVRLESLAPSCTVSIMKDGKGKFWEPASSDQDLSGLLPDAIHLTFPSRALPALRLEDCKTCLADALMTGDDMDWECLQLPE